MWGRKLVRQRREQKERERERYGVGKRACKVKMEKVCEEKEN